LIDRNIESEISATNESKRKHSLDQVDVNLASRDDLLEDGSQKFFRVSVLESTFLALFSQDNLSVDPYLWCYLNELTFVTAVRTAATMTTSSAELSNNLARPMEGMALAMDDRVEDIVCKVKTMCSG
jgi:hypothetical protein